MDWQTQYNNWATPESAVALLMKFLGRPAGISADYNYDATYDLVLQAMTESPTGPNRLKGLLPKDTPVAHKTGTSGARQHHPRDKRHRYHYAAKRQPHRHRRLRRRFACRRTYPRSRHRSYRKSGVGQMVDPKKAGDRTGRQQNRFQSAAFAELIEIGSDVFIKRAEHAAITLAAREAKRNV